MEERQGNILHELYVFSEWKPEPEYLQKPDNILPEHLSSLWRWLNFFGPKKSLIDSVSLYKERQLKWHIALGDEGKVIAVLTDNILEIRTKRSEYATIAARTTVSRDAYTQWRKVVWSPDCSFVAVAYGNGVVSFFDLTASNLFNIPIDCNRPGGLECTDNTHAVADIIFMPLRVKDNKWNWEVLIVTYDGKLRGYLVSQTDGFKLHHTFRFAGGVGACAYSPAHSLLLVAGLPRGKDPSSPLHAGLTAWRILNDDPFYKLSVACDQLEAQMATDGFQLYVPFLATANLAFIVNMSISSDNSKLVCIHCTGEISVWRLPVLKVLHRWPLQNQPEYDAKNPLVKDAKEKEMYNPVDVNWWSDEEIIVSRANGSVTVCRCVDMRNVLGSRAQFLHGGVRVTRAQPPAALALALEGETAAAADTSHTELTKTENAENTAYEMTKELFKSVLYAITDIETFQPKPKKITVVSRIYRLLGIKSTTPEELFSRNIESGHYTDALKLAKRFNLDSDQVYQQQWRKTPVSTDAIQKYLSKVSKKIWTVHQCVDRLPETLPAAKELLQFGLKLTNTEILHEINKDRETENWIDTPDKITLEDLNSYSSELLRCRHVMLFYKERLRLYEAILRCEKSTYVKDEYDRLRSNSIVHSATELAKEGRISALTCLWPHVKSVPMKMTVLDNIPETIDPYQYKNLLESLVKVKKTPVQEELESDWCKKEIFQSIWSNWSEDQTPDKEKESQKPQTVSSWYAKRAKEIEARCGIISHALNLVTLGHNQGIMGLDVLMYNFKTLDTLIYDLNLEGITLDKVHHWSALETCKQLMTLKTPETFLMDLKTYVVPYLKRYEQLINQPYTCIQGLTEYLESLSVDDLSWVLLVLQSPTEFELDKRTHLDIAEQCLMAHNTTEQLDKACDVLSTILKKNNDDSISPTDLLRRVKELERLLSICRIVWWRGVNLPLSDLKKLSASKEVAKLTLTRVARSLALTEKPTPQDWEKLLKDIMLLQLDACSNVSIEQCYEIYSSSLLTSGDAASIKLAGDVLTCSAVEVRRGRQHLVPYDTSIALILTAAKEYFNSAMSLTDPSLELSKCCLLLVRDGNPQIQEELDLIASLQILNAFNLSILPIQVRLCEDRMTLIEECVKSESNGYMTSHRLLKLAKLLRVAGDDEQKREGQVLQLVCTSAAAAAAAEGGGSAAAAAAEAARKLAALRYKPAAALLTRIANTLQGHLDRNARKELLAAAVTHCDPHSIDAILKSRLSLEVEALEQMDSTLRVQSNLKDLWPSVDDEFADAITTPVVEKKDIVEPSTEEPKIPLFRYLMETWQKKSSDQKPSVEVTDRNIHCQEFYRTLYPYYFMSTQHYGYDCFSMPVTTVDELSIAEVVIKWYFSKSTVGADEPRGDISDVECGAVQKCADELLYKDTPLSVCCLMRSSQYNNLIKKFVESNNSDSAVSAALYATLIKCNTPEMRDNAYLAKPLKMARTTLKQRNASPDQSELIRACLDKLMTLVELNKMKSSGCPVNGPMFVADPDYRQQVVYRMARSTERDQFKLASKLAKKYEISTLELWIQHLTTVIGDSVAIKEIFDILPTDINKQDAITRIKSEIWDNIRGDDHNTLINYFSVIKGLDEKTPLNGLTAADHIKLLKKAKAASSELNYKLLLEQPSPEEFSSHILHIIKPENVGLLTKLLRTLPPAFKIPISVNTLYTLWLTKYFFSVSPSSATSKKWMQQYRQCASYFNKLSKDDLLEFVTNTCFSTEAVERVPAGTRNLMIMQAVDYCQQEQDNDLKLNKNEATWAQLGQELSRWARYLENFHSTTIQSIIENNIPGDQVWIDIERSHGDMEKLRRPLCRLVLESELKPSSLGTLLQCLHIATDVERIFTNTLDEYIDNSVAMQTFVSKLIYYHKEGVKFSENLLDTAMQMATVYGLPPHKQIGLLSLSQKNQIQDGDDWLKVVQFTLDLFKVEWPESKLAQNLTDQSLLNDESRRDIFMKFLDIADTWQRKKALVDVLNCWPPSRNSVHRSLHCDYIKFLLCTADHTEGLLLMKLLLRKPVLVEEEIEWLSNNAPRDAVINMVWIILLSKCDHSKDMIPKLVQLHKEYIREVEIDNDLVKELLQSGLFLKLVSTPLYSSIINYILSAETSNTEPLNVFSVKWAISELLKANFIGEAGHLKLLALGVPTPLRNFSQSVFNVKHAFNK